MSTFFPAPQRAAITFASSGDNTIISAAAGKATYVWGIFFVVAAATNITVKDGTGGTALTGAMPLTANGSFFWWANPAAPLFLGTQNNNFVLNSSNAVQVSGWVLYSQG